MTIREKIASYTVDQRIRIMKGIDKNFPKHTDADGKVTVDFTPEFEMYQELLKMFTAPLTDFFRANKIPFVTQNEHPPREMNVGDAVRYLLNESSPFEIQTNKL